MDNNVLKYRNMIGCEISSLAEEVALVAKSVIKTPVMVTWREKDPLTLRKKMHIKRTDSVLLVHDVYGIRILVNSVDEAYSVLKEIMIVFSGFLDHDYIKDPKVRPDKPQLGGKSLRLLQYIAHKNSIPFEIQITTMLFHKQNEQLHAEYHREKYD